VYPKVGNPPAGDLRSIDATGPNATGNVSIIRTVVCSARRDSRSIDVTGPNATGNVIYNPYGSIQYFALIGITDTSVPPC
jgi:hypothetical protein